MSHTYRSHATTTQVNYKSVGSGHWSLNSIRNYCAKKGIELKQAAHVTYDINYGFDTENLDLNTGKVASFSNYDAMSRMLGQ